MAFNLQHPDITHALNCGEDTEPMACYCDTCGDGIAFGEKFYKAVGGTIFCKDCMEGEIKELGLDYVAEALGFESEVIE